VKKLRWWLKAVAASVAVLAPATAGLAQEVTPLPEAPVPGPAQQVPKPGPETAPATVATQPAEGPGQERPRVALEIECAGEFWGSIVLELHAQRAPATVANFLRYVDEGFYDGTIFHRVLAGFIVQGGGYVSPEQQKLNGLHEPVRNESRGAQKNRRGTVAMARKRDPHSAVCQFFINLADNEMLDFPRAGAYGYCVFGEVVQGMDIVDRMATLPTQVSPLAQRRFERYQQQGKHVNQPEQSLPLTPPVIRKARRLAPEEATAPTAPSPVSQPSAEEPSAGGSESGREPESAPIRPRPAGPNHAGGKH
jgi:peptidyl-prolyl cis-trans isomerase B (cyclophilin B)